MRWSDQGGQWNMMDGTSGAWAWFMMVPLLLLVAAVVIALVLVVRRAPATSPSAGSPAGRAGRILDERYASSEIDEDEYRRRQAVLLDG